MIDAVGAGSSWPQLQTDLGVESARNLLFALLAPSPGQNQALKGNDAWLPEAKALFESALGLKLLTKAKSWDSVADELWRFVLFLRSSVSTLPTIWLLRLSSCLAIPIANSARRHWRKFALPPRDRPIH